MRRALDIPDLVHLARKLRREQTPAEEILWALLRGRQLLGLKFRRQQQVGPFIADSVGRFLGGPRRGGDGESRRALKSDDAVPQ